jgi:hypothetical protein
MKYEVFVEVVNLLKGYKEKEDAVYKQGLDLYNFTEQLQYSVSLLIGSIYGKDGLETFDWWCYDKEWGTRDDLTMTDREGNQLCRTIEELHQYLEENKTEDFELKKPLSDEEREEIFKAMTKEFNK